MWVAEIAAKRLRDTRYSKLQLIHTCEYAILALSSRDMQASPNLLE